MLNSNKHEVSTVHEKMTAEKTNHAHDVFILLINDMMLTVYPANKCVKVRASHPTLDPRMQ